MTVNNEDKSMSISGSGNNHLENGLAHTETHATFFDKEDINNLTQEHRDYLLQRHGTLDLDPIPYFGDADPYNWPMWKVRHPEHLALLC